jgi:ubiquinone biosynthesis O-methyltransferase
LSVPDPNKTISDSREKVRSLLAEPGGPGRVREKYEEIYEDSEAWLYAKSHGVHSVVYSLIADRVRGRTVLDVGCGAGRLAIMCAHHAVEVRGFDFSETAIVIADLNAASAGQDVDFRVADIDTFCATSETASYDVVTMLGVLEHVEDPVATLRDISPLIRDGGTLVVSCPNFINPRGFMYMTLLTLFGLPMSLADLRQVDHMNLREWAAATGYGVEQVAGALYRFGWDEKAVADMERRVPLAVHDSGLDLPLDYERYGAWLERMAAPMTETLAWLESRGVLQRIRRALELRFERVVDVGDELWERMSRYMNENIEADPFYSTEPPFAYLGGECIYVLEKLP